VAAPLFDLDETLLASVCRRGEYVVREVPS
jgi:hypothetical protein